MKSVRRQKKPSRWRVAVLVLLLGAACALALKRDTDARSYRRNADGWAAELAESVKTIDKLKAQHCTAQLDIYTVVNGNEQPVRRYESQTGQSTVQGQLSPGVYVRMLGTSKLSEQEAGK